MKKIYIAPSMQIVKIKTVCLTTLSMQNETATKTGGYYDESRRFDDWDDE